MAGSAAGGAVGSNDSPKHCAKKTRGRWNEDEAEWTADSGQVVVSERGAADGGLAGRAIR